MALSKKIRFEVFKRDGFQCCYCGRKPPEVILECDHVNPKSKGGEDDIDNLITACFDCNRGKGATELGQVPPGVKEKLALAREREAQLDEYNDFLKQSEKKIQSRIDEVCDYIVQILGFEIVVEGSQKMNLRNDQILYYEQVLDQKNINTIRIFCRKIPVEEIKDAVRIACGKFNRRHYVFYSNKIPPYWMGYFCGVCWKKIRGER